jgi:hypothetical protein
MIPNTIADITLPPIILDQWRLIVIAMPASHPVWMPSILGRRLNPFAVLASNPAVDLTADRNSLSVVR